MACPAASVVAGLMSDVPVTLLMGSRETGLRSKPAPLELAMPSRGEVIPLQATVGRPRTRETQARTQQFWAVLAATGSFVQALDSSRLDGRRMAKLLDSPEGRATAFQLCNQVIAA